MMVLWLLMLRAIGIEFRAHIPNLVWRNFFDAVFAFSSTLLAIFFGAALGNVIRGVPLGPDGYFFEPLWTSWHMGPHPGILDWYTVLAGTVALAALTVHGALYVAIKTEGDVSQRARGIAITVWPILFFLTVSSLAATCYVRRGITNNYRAHPIALLIPIVVFGAVAMVIWAARQSKDKLAFLACGLYIAGMLAGAAFALYPMVLPAVDPAYSLTIYNTATGHHGLIVGLTWSILGMALAIAYFFFIYRMFKGKVQVEEEVS